MQAASAFERVRAAVHTHGGGIASSDATIGVVTSKWKQHSDLEDNKYFYRVRVSVKELAAGSASIGLELDVQVCDSRGSLVALDEQCEGTKQIPSSLTSDFEKFRAFFRRAVFRAK